MLTIPFAVYLIGLALVLYQVFRRAGEDDNAGAGRLALKCGLAGGRLTEIWEDVHDIPACNFGATRQVDRRNLSP